MFLIKSAFVGKEALYLSKCTVKRQFKKCLLVFYIPKFLPCRKKVVKGFYDIQFSALIFKIHKNPNKCIILWCKVFTIKALELRHASTLCVGHAQGMWINICIQHRL